MDADVAQLLSRLKSEQARISDRMHRDSRRQHTLRQASLMLGTGMSADSVLDWLATAHITFPAPVSIAEAVAARRASR